MRYYRKVIKIRAEDSPNVRLALLEQAAGREPSGEIVVPGVLPYHDYRKRRATWDAVRQTVGLDAEFYEGAEVLLFPPQWLNRAEFAWQGLRAKTRKARAVGIDPGEGGDRTAMAAVDEYGLVELVSRRTPDTSVITGEALAFCRRHGVPPERACFDRGGGGKEHADRLRSQGFPARTVAFGEAVTAEPRRGQILFEERKDVREDHYVYKNRRAQMFGELSLLFDPSLNPEVFALPPGSEGEAYRELRRQLAVFPKRYDQEGRLKLPPKNRRDPLEPEDTLFDLLGCSPDEADALALAVHAMQHRAAVQTAGAY